MLNKSEQFCGSGGQLLREPEADYQIDEANDDVDDVE